MEPRQITRWDAVKYAREAYDMGIRYIGGCCAFESYHIRAIAEELREERGGILPESSQESSDIDFSHYIQRNLERGFPTRRYIFTLQCAQYNTIIPP